LRSLDRIDSQGHYATGNSQLVCRFENHEDDVDNDSSHRVNRLIGLYGP